MAKTTKNSSHSSMLSVLQRLSMKDMLIVGDTADRVMADMTRFAETDPIADGAALEVASRQNLALAYGYDDSTEGTRKPFVFQDGIAVIPIHGTLINRFNSSWGFVTGYNYIRRMVNLALDDDDVEFIVFDVDSPGGEAAGCFELAREIMASRRVKPSLSVVDSLAASGGVALGLAPTTAYAIPSARIGSIGVYRMHVSFEGALKKEGIKVTFAQAGDFKTDGNPYKDLPQRVLDEWTESAGKTWDDFISLVAEARGLSEADVRATQARVYRADEALDLGLIDAVKTTSEAVAAWIAELADDDPSNSDEEEANMTDVKKGSEVTSGLTAADLEKIGGMIATAVGGAVAGITRSSEIKDYAASKGKAFVALGATLAADANISVDQAKTIIDAASGTTGKVALKGKGQNVSGPEDDEDEDDAEDGEGEDSDDEDEDDAEEAAEQARRSRLKAKGSKGKQKVKTRKQGDDVNHFDRAMGNSRNPNLGAGNDRQRSQGEPTDEELGAQILADAYAGGSSWAKPASQAKH